MANIFQLYSKFKNQFRYYYSSLSMLIFHFIDRLRILKFYYVFKQVIGSNQFHFNQLHFVYLQ